METGLYIVSAFVLGSLFEFPIPCHSVSGHDLRMLPFVNPIHAFRTGILSGTAWYEILLVLIGLHVTKDFRKGVLQNCECKEI